MGWDLRVYPPAFPSPGPCATLTGHAYHLPLQSPLWRHHCTPRTREMVPRRVPRMKQKIMGRVPALRGGSGAKGGSVGTVRGGSSLSGCTAWGIVTLGLDHLSLWGGGGAPRGEMTL